MISKSWSRKSIATVVAVAVLSVYSMVVLAAPGAKASGELSVSGQVMVNGQKMVSGGTIFTDSVISTAPQSSASVNIAKVGRVDLSANSNLRISFSESSITAMLETGSAQVSTLAGTTVNLTTKDGTVVVDGKEATSFSVSASRGRTSMTTLSGVAQFRTGTTVKQVAAGESAVAGTPNPQTDDDDDDMSGGALAVLLLAVGGAVAGILYATLHNNDLNFGGSVTVVSPTK
ncbi:MAG TPA: FecR domain-containing protein [Pyrinomonadaceae bacterium]|jgi:ferric-dicitrate binding protein FerR (iron transport regulator)|nr:FecR domain-containing protein [Pyrinomonadaceae bacterium]